MDFYKIGLQKALEELEDKFTKADIIFVDEDRLAKFDEAMDLLRAIIEEVKK